jgi:prolyl oligopeptidase
MPETLMLPATRRDDVRETLHGTEVLDPYRWLEDQESPETRAWIDAQIAHTQAVLGGFAGREELRRRLEGLLRIDSYGMPVARGGWYFFMKRLADRDQPVLCRRRGHDGPDEVLIDPAALAGNTMVSVVLLDVSEDGQTLVYGLRTGGADEITVHLRDLASGEELPDTLPAGRYFGVSLTHDLRALYYSLHTEEGGRIRRRALGTGEEAEVFGEGYGPEKIISADLSEDGRWLLITVYYGSAADKTEVYVKDLRTDRPVVPIINDVTARFTGEIAGGMLYLETNWEAPNGRVLAVDLADPARESRDTWREVVPESGAVIQGVSLAGGRLFLNLLENVQSRVRIYTPEGADAGEIAFPTIGSVSGVYGRWGEREAFFHFASFHVPPTIYRVDVETGERSVWASVSVPVDTDALEVRQVWFDSRDGTRVPMFLVHRKGLEMDGRRPVYLTGYGGFNASMTPSFSAIAALWAERGGVYALANLRGGGEFGEEWHRAGMRERKQNVFDDFTGAAEWLIANGVTSPEKLAVAGGSNGGLLVGAALTQRPELFQAVVCAVPLLDMVRYHQFLVARFWVPEYGSSEDPELFPTLHGYSPYHRVREGENYPAVLFMTGDSDTRVAPLHARKMCALLQAASASGRPVLLHYDTKAGHSGGLPITKQIEDAADQLAFLFQQLDIE